MFVKLDELKLEVRKKVESIILTAGPKVEKKPDKTLVTDIDTAICQIVKSWMKTNYCDSQLNYYSEEDKESFELPCMVLDPIDGTRELVSGSGECVLSLAILQDFELDSPKNHALIFNPFTGFSIDSTGPFFPKTKPIEKTLTGMISRSEKGRNLFSDEAFENFLLVPRGSIAFKLGLLAAGACDFVISLGPKNVWDIAAGAVLLKQRGINTYVVKDGSIVELKDLSQDFYSPPMCWCRPEYIGQLETMIPAKKKSE